MYRICELCGKEIVSVPYYHIGEKHVCEDCAYSVPIVNVLEAIGAELEDPLIVEIDPEQYHFI